jgi:hypothetical protein
VLPEKHCWVCGRYKTAHVTTEGGVRIVGVCRADRKVRTPDHECVQLDGFIPVVVERPKTPEMLEAAYGPSWQMRTGTS